MAHKTAVKKGKSVTRIVQALAIVGVILVMTACGGGGDGGLGGGGGGPIVVMIPGLASITFPPGSIGPGVQPGIAASTAADYQTNYAESASIYEADASYFRAIVVTVGSSAPILDVPVQISVPSSFVAALSAGYIPALFAQETFESDLESLLDFEPLEFTYDPADLSLKANLPPEDFSPDSTTGKYTAVLVIGSVAAESGSAELAPILPSDVSQCLDALSSPLEGVANSDLPGMVRKPDGLFGAVSLLRDHPHMGVDIASARGSTVTPALDGLIVRVGYQEVGAGVYVVVRHDFGNRVAATKYMHLVEGTVLDFGPNGKLTLPTSSNSGTFSNSIPASRGDKIGEVDNTGHSTGNHLHLEYAPKARAVRQSNGTYKWDGKKTDPLPCFQYTVSVSTASCTLLALSPTVTTVTLTGQGTATGWAAVFLSMAPPVDFNDLTPSGGVSTLTCPSWSGPPKCQGPSASDPQTTTWTWTYSIDTSYVQRGISPDPPPPMYTGVRANLVTSYPLGPIVALGQLGTVCQFAN